MQVIKNQLQKRLASGKLRTLKIKKPLIDFGSNDSLGLARSKQLSILVAKERLQLQKETGLTTFCSTGSRLLSGNQHYTEILEQKIATFHGYEAGLIFNCGYMANLGLLSSIALEGDVILYDSQVHASTKAGIQLSKAKALPFFHHCLDHLEKRLKQIRGKRVFVCIESIYSTNGDVAPLIEMIQLCERFHAHLIVDETHAIGVYGPQGRGLVAKLKLQSHIFASVCSFAKALGGYGAIVMGGKILRKYLINFAHSFIYTTALPLQNLAVIKSAYDLLPFLNQERNSLFNLMNSFKKNSSHIFLYRLSSPFRLDQCVAFFSDRGIQVSPLKSPTVSKKNEGLRITLHAFNHFEELNLLIHTFHEWEKRHG